MRHGRTRKLLLGPLAAVLCGLVLVLPALPARAATPVTVTGVWLSTYDWWNNSPAGCGIEYARSYGYPTIDDCAGNSVNNAPGRTGAYSDPITYASQDSGVFSYPPGTIVYIAYFSKYFILEDLCSTCYTAQPQMDLWVGGVSSAQEADQSNPADIVNLWQQETVIVSPPADEPVNTSPFYQANPQTGLQPSGQPPAVTTNAASGITSAGATLNGSVNPGGASTTYKFDYGTTTGYGSSVPAPAGSAGSGSSAVSESYALAGLAAGTAYHYRIEASSAVGTSYGADQVFTTAAGGGARTGHITMTTAPSKCMDDMNNATANGTRMRIWDCTSLPTSWTVNTDSTITFSGKCMTAEGTASGSVADLQVCNGGSSQKWTYAGGTLAGVQSGKCLDDPGGVLTNGTQLDIYTCNGSSGQKWTLPA